MTNVPDGAYATVGVAPLARTVVAPEVPLITTSVTVWLPTLVTEATGTAVASEGLVAYADA